jgi:hypothetical protein
VAEETITIGRREIGLLLENMHRGACSGEIRIRRSVTAFPVCMVQPLRWVFSSKLGQLPLGINPSGSTCCQIRHAVVRPIPLGVDHAHPASERSQGRMRKAAMARLAPRAYFRVHWNAPSLDRMNMRMAENGT